MAPTGRDIFSLSTETFLITGASSGLGVEAARALAGQGAKVVLTARREERLEALARELPNASYYACDLSCTEEIESLWRFCDEEVGVVTGLVNNAGRAIARQATEESDDEFRSVLEVNLVSVFAMSKRFAQRLIDRNLQGVVVNVASVLGLLGSGQVPLASYVSSKAGVVNLTRELALQWARYGIRVNAVAPGWFFSEMTKDMFSDEVAQRWIAQRTPMGRAGEVGELDGVFIFLSSNASSYITGQTFVVDGGWSIL